MISLINCFRNASTLSWFCSYKRKWSQVESLTYNAGSAIFHNRRQGVDIWILHFLIALTTSRTNPWCFRPLSADAKILQSLCISPIASSGWLPSLLKVYLMTSMIGPIILVIKCTFDAFTSKDGSQPLIEAIGLIHRDWSILASADKGQKHHIVQALRFFNYIWFILCIFVLLTNSVFAMWHQYCCAVQLLLLGTEVGDRSFYGKSSEVSFSTHQCLASTS